MCEWGKTRTVNVIRRNNPYIDDGWHQIQVDSCIADYVQRLNDQGIITLGCCCGHDKPELPTPNVVISKESIPLLDALEYKYESVDEQFGYHDEMVRHFIPEANGE